MASSVQLLPQSCNWVTRVLRWTKLHIAILQHLSVTTIFYGPMACWTGYTTRTVNFKLGGIWKEALLGFLASLRYWRKITNHVSRQTQSPLCIWTEHLRSTGQKLVRVPYGPALLSRPHCISTVMKTDCGSRTVACWFHTASLTNPPRRTFVGIISEGITNTSVRVDSHRSSWQLLY